MCLSNALSFYAALYFQLSKTEKKLVKFLRWYQNRFPKSFPKLRTIAEFAGVSERAIQKIFSKFADDDLLKDLIKIDARFEKNGRQTTNQYVLNNNLKMALDWLDIYGYLNAPKKKQVSIISSMRNEEKVHPPSPQKVHPSSKDSSFSKDSKETLKRKESFHPIFEGIGISDEVKLLGTLVASDRELYETMEICAYQSKKQKIQNPSEYFRSVLKKKVFEYRGIQL